MDSPLLEDEKFDFDLPLTPENEREEDDEEDEIFFGPVGYNELCVATNTETKAAKYLDEVDNLKPMSPLNPEQVVEIFKEATSIALMFRTSSSEAVLGDKEKKTSSDCPELINDVTESRLRALKSDGKENEKKTVETLENSDKPSTAEKLSENNDEDTFVVRKRLLRERNTKSIINKKPPNNTTKSKMIKKGQTAPVQSSSGSISKPQKFKQIPKTSCQNSPLKVNKMLIYGVVEDSPQSPTHEQKPSVKKSNVVTPRRISSSSSKAERSFSSTKSSSASDSSFTEETTKLLKLPMASQSGLKAPSLSSGCRKRTTSFNSSISSTSSTSSVSALNETFTVSKSSTSPPSSIKQPKMKLQPNPKPLLTKIGLSRPTFAKPNEVPKTSKLQPMKALPRATAGTARSTSATSLKSPAHIKNNPRAASAGSTPLRAQTPRADRTPSKGTTPIRRRSSVNSSTSTAVAKKRQSGLVPSNDVIKKPSTPQARKNTSRKVGSVGKPTEDVVSFGVVARRKPNEGTKSEKQNEKPTTPERRPKADKALITTPKNTGEMQRNNRMSKSCKKRRSFIPTPNLNRTIESFKTVDSGSPKAPSPVPFHLSPTSKQWEKAKTNEENVEELANTVSDSEKKEFKVNTSQSPDGFKCEKLPDASPSELADNQPSGDAKSPESVQSEEPDLMIQQTPDISKVKVDEVVDPFSPGIPTPDLPPDDCLNPVVLQIDTKDLIDLSHMSPKPEPDLIDLAADSPIHLVEAKLVDI